MKLSEGGAISMTTMEPGVYIFFRNGGMKDMGGHFKMRKINILCTL